MLNICMVLYDLCLLQNFIVSYFTTVGFQPFNLSWYEAPWSSQPKIFIIFPKLNTCSHSSYAASCLRRKWVCLSWIGSHFAQFMYQICYWKCFLLHHIWALLVELRVWKADHACLYYFLLQLQISHLTAVKFRLLYFLCLHSLCPVVYNMGTGWNIVAPLLLHTSIS